MNKKTVYLFTWALSICSLYLAEYAKAILSISIISLCVSSLFYWKNYHAAFKRKDLMILGGSTLLLYLIQFFYSDNLNYLTERIQIKLPIIILPIVLSFADRITRKDYFKLLYLFIIITSIACLYILFEFINDYEHVVNLYLQSKVMSGPINHIRFSIIVSLACYLSYYLYQNYKEFLTKRDRYILVFSCLLLFVFIHVYSVRSGLLALYALIFWQIVRYVFTSRKILKGLTVTIAFAALAISFIFFSPTLRNKVENTKSDIGNMNEGKDPNYNSLGTRVVSYQVAFEIFQENPLWGCGIGDLIDLNTKKFREEYPTIVTPIIPHNQFIYFLAGSGLIGVLIFIAGFFSPLFFRHNWKNEVLIAQYILLFLSFQTEPMLETQLGVAYSILFILLPMCVVDDSVVKQEVSGTSV